MTNCETQPRNVSLSAVQSNLCVMCIFTSLSLLTKTSHLERDSSFILLSTSAKILIGQDLNRQRCTRFVNI